MGNKSGSEFGGILIRTEKQLYYSGDIIKGRYLMLSGNIYLHIIKQGFHGKKVRFSIIGKETTKFYTGGGKTKRTHIGTNIVHQQSVDIHEFQDDNLQMGSFVFSFQLQLPLLLPGSYFFEDDIKGSIVYKVRAKFVSSSNSINNIKNKQVIIIREPIKLYIQSMTLQDTVQIISCWCYKQLGTSSLKCTIDKNYYFPGEMAILQIEPDNSQCKNKIQQIEISLINIITLVSAETFNTYKFELRKEIIQVAQGMQILPENLNQYQFAIRNDNEPKTTFQATTNGVFVQSKYNISIRLRFEGLFSYDLGCTCFSKYPFVVFNITIFTIQPEEHFYPIKQPENWNPQVFQPEIILPVQPERGQNNNLQQMNNLILE